MQASVNSVNFEVREAQVLSVEELEAVNGGIAPLVAAAVVVAGLLYSTDAL